MTATATAEQPDDKGAPERDLSVVLPVEGLVDVEGIQCRVRRLRAREILDLARIIAAGLGNAVTDLDFDFSNPEQLKASVSAMLMIALPNAEDEVFAFLGNMVVPVDSDEGGTVRDLMRNPDLGVVLDVLNTILDQEGPALVDHLGKARTLTAAVGKLIPKTPQPKTPPSDVPAAGRGGRSRARST